MVVRFAEEAWEIPAPNRLYSWNFGFVVDRWRFFSCRIKLREVRTYGSSSRRQKQRAFIEASAYGQGGTIAQESSMVTPRE